MSDENAHLELREREDGKYDWHLVAANGEELCGTQQGYRDPHDATRGFDATVTAIADLVQQHIGRSWAEGQLFIDVVKIPRGGGDRVDEEDLEALDAEAAADRDAKHAAKHAERAARAES